MGSKSLKQLIIQFGVDTAGRMKASVPTIVKYAKVELVPPKLTELSEIRQGFSNLCLAHKSKSYRNLTVKEAWLNTLITAEVILWFFVGEIIGRRNLVGYHQKL